MIRSRCHKDPPWEVSVLSVGTMDSTRLRPTALHLVLRNLINLASNTLGLHLSFFLVPGPWIIPHYLCIIWQTKSHIFSSIFKVLLQKGAIPPCPGSFPIRHPCIISSTQLHQTLPMLRTHSTLSHLWFWSIHCYEPYFKQDKTQTSFKVISLTVFCLLTSVSYTSNFDTMKQCLTVSNSIIF